MYSPMGHTYPLAIFSFHVHEVGGVEAAVHTLLIPGDSTFNSDTTWSWTQDKFLRIGHIN